VKISHQAALDMRDKVQQYLADQGFTFDPGDAVPMLYDHDHEDLYPGCWSIVFVLIEAADWPFKFGDAVFQEMIEIPWFIDTEAQSSYTMNLYPKGE
jgi:hypothetical protein